MGGADGRAMIPQNPFIKTNAGSPADRSIALNEPKGTSDDGLKKQKCEAKIAYRQKSAQPGSGSDPGLPLGLSRRAFHRMSVFIK
jgi:hypothetical protein